MKALSVRQPWAELILRGRKTVELRTWKVHYRGPLLIHAAAVRRPERVHQLGLDPDALAYGALLGVVTLVDVTPLDEAAYEALRDQHLRDAPYPGPPLFAWHFRHPRPFARPIPWPGRQGLFSVPEDRLLAHEPDLPLLPTSPPDKRRPFVLYAFPENGQGYRVVLYQWLGWRSQGEHGLSPWWRVELRGRVLRFLGDALVQTLRQAGYRPGDLVRRFGEPFFLPEVLGVRLALLFLAAKPLKRVDRVDALVAGIARMSDEEAYYWFSQCSSGPNARRSQRALRILLAGG